MMPARDHLNAVRSFWRAREGNTAVEFAMVAPALFLLIFGTLEFGRLLWTQSSLHYAVEQTARCASVTPSICGTNTQIQTYAANTISYLNVGTSTFSSSSTSCGHQISASFNYQFIATGLFPFTPTLTAQACSQ